MIGINMLMDKKDINLLMSCRKQHFISNICFSGSDIKELFALFSLV